MTYLGRVNKYLALFTCTVALSLLSSCSSGTAAATAAPPLPSIWVAAWGAPPENSLVSAQNPGSSEQSFRSIVIPTIDGTQERVHFSNAYGTSPITIGSARIAVAGTAAAVVAGTDQPLTFSGSTSVTIPAGQQVTSDSVNVTYTFGQRLAISAYVKGTFPPLTQHDAQGSINYASAPNAGDTTTDTTGEAFSTSVTEWYLLSGVDVYGPYQGTIVYFGSSSVDGHGSNYGSTNAYPAANVPIAGQDDQRPSDWLAKSLVAAGYHLGVLNAGTIGDPAADDPRTASGLSVSGINRMNRDVIQQPNVKAVVIYFGGVDLRADCRTATDIETSLTNLVAQAQIAGIRVILATVPPAEYCLTSDASLLPSAANPWQGDLNPGPENPGSTERRTLNTWTRTTGSTLPGVVAIADFDAALAYPAHPDFMMPNFTSSDNFHPTGLGYKAQSGAISLPSLLGH